VIACCWQASQLPLLQKEPKAPNKKVSLKGMHFAIHQG